MGEDASSSMIWNAKTNVADEASDSNTSSFMLQTSNKRARVNDLNDVAILGKFKGVVPQQNGRWGAQIYANHQRIWLGTFKSEKEAAMAYDSAAIKLRSRDSHRNFPWTGHTIKEPNFQDQFSTDAVLNMIKDGSYFSKFSAFLQTTSRSHQSWVEAAAANSEELNNNDQKQRVNNGDGRHHFSRSHLFQKELTPSDVGKLNRLVIPKKYAVKHFPYISESEEENGVGSEGAMDDIELAFYDTSMKTWKFRYCYWKSSQSFVFTRGWNRFVKEKKLKAHDIITFYTYENGDHDDQKEEEEEEEGGQTLYLIDVIYKRSEDESHSCLPEIRCSDKVDEMQIALELQLGKILSFEKVGEEKECGKKKVLNQNVGDKRIRLFGVHIN